MLIYIQFCTEYKNIFEEYISTCIICILNGDLLTDISIALGQWFNVYLCKFQIPNLMKT